MQTEGRALVDTLFNFKDVLFHGGAIAKRASAYHQQRQNTWWYPMQQLRYTSSHLCLNFCKLKLNYPSKWTLTMLVPSIYQRAPHQATKQDTLLDTRYHFVHNYLKNGILNMVFIRLDENDADTSWQRNLSIRLYHCGWLQEKSKGDENY